ncbi:aminoglycoside phosphotransferase family protein [Streptomyces profundus]|uniref:aminoglycoside phosphotransferase family protein n=1 Tax=Streptomyces profundus TaxID=2867410 RepID=UPI001D1699B1|nr:aminoglycoside phosphotransferase family protein [Streptomyces sp. MA3_2.13]UED86320.1 aminoglycoside phosphotransferase family protein [Streptomyces sp. MA3_2.13]
MNEGIRARQSLAILREICAVAGFDATGAEPIRLGENDLWRLPEHIVVRISRAEQSAAAEREVAVTRWLADHAVPAVRPLAIEQPLHAQGRPATFWEELPRHHPGTETDLAPLLRQLHDLPQPDFPIGQLNPLIRVKDRIVTATTITEQDRTWLLSHFEALRHDWETLPTGLPHSVVHGDAWGGNCAITVDGAVLMDFERTSLGPPEWDLTSTAIRSDTFGTLSHEDYQQFCDAYGHDVTTWPGYPTLRTLRELRALTFALQTATDNPAAIPEAHHRLSCVQGRAGPRPWVWTSVA